MVGLSVEVSYRTPCNVATGRRANMVRLIEKKKRNGCLWNKSKKKNPVCSLGNKGNKRECTCSSCYMLKKGHVSMQ